MKLFARSVRLAWANVPLLKLRQQYNQLSPTTVCLLGLVYVLGVTWLDEVTPPRLNFTVLYILGVALVGWRAGKRQAVVVCLVTTLLYAFHDLELHRTDSQAWITAWNMAARAASIMAVGWLSAELARLTRNLGRLVEQRTALWQAEAQQLRLSQRQLAEAMDLAAMANWEYDVATRTFLVNDRFWHLHGTTAEREKGYRVLPETYLREFFYPEDGPLMTLTLEKALGQLGPNDTFQVERRLRRRDGQIRHAVARLAVARDAAGHTTKIYGVTQDITERKRLERQILEISDREQARIGQDLHDGLCQQLVSLAFDANTLEHDLAGQRHPQAATARRIADVLDQSITEARQLSRGLFPIRLEADGLPSALEELARSISERQRVECLFRCEGAVRVKDRAVATHLYRIAQEAVTNAVKHAQPRRITIELLAQATGVELRVTDDGRGLPAPASARPTGMGLHIMDYRARTIGGILQLTPAAPAGTSVSCRLAYA